MMRVDCLPMFAVACKDGSHPARPLAASTGAVWSQRSPGARQPYQVLLPTPGELIDHERKVANDAPDLAPLVRFECFQADFPR